MDLVEEQDRAAVAFAEAGADMLVLSGGFVSRTGFYMLRGDVPLAEMAEALASRNLARYFPSNASVKTFLQSSLGRKT